MTYATCHTDFFKLDFQQVRKFFVCQLDMAEELKRSCDSVGAGSRTHGGSRFLWLLFAVRALQVMRSYVWSRSTVRSHHCCLQRVRKLSSSTTDLCYHSPLEKMLSDVSVGKFLLSQSLQLFWHASLGHASFIGVSAHDVLGVLAACSRT